MQKNLKTINAQAYEPWVDIEEAARFLGVKPSFIQYRIKEIPHVKVGRMNRFRISDLNAYALDCGRNPISPK